MADHPTLTLVKNYVSAQFETEIISYLDDQDWNETIKARRTQMYGYDYGFQSHSIKKAPKVEGPLLDVMNRLNRDYEAHLIQVIVNEYGPRGSIGAHIDDLKFGDHVFGISLGSPGELRFTKDGDAFTVHIPPRSLYIMEGDLRYKWKHAVHPNKTLTLPDGTKMKKDHDYRRISLTFRSV